MKLSDLETLVKAMREHANAQDLSNPNVEFWASAGPPDDTYFVHYEPTLDNADISQHQVVKDGAGRRVGDFSIPLRRA